MPSPARSHHCEASSRHRCVCSPRCTIRTAARRDAVQDATTAPPFDGSPQLIDDSSGEAPCARGDEAAAATSAPGTPVRNLPPIAPLFTNLLLKVGIDQRPASASPSSHEPFTRGRLELEGRVVFSSLAATLLAAKYAPTAVECRPGIVSGASDRKMAAHLQTVCDSSLKFTDRSCCATSPPIAMTMAHECECTKIQPPKVRTQAE
jgi:hypothetical protein